MGGGCFVIAATHDAFSALRISRATFSALPLLNLPRITRAMSRGRSSAPNCPAAGAMLPDRGEWRFRSDRRDELDCPTLLLWVIHPAAIRATLVGDDVAAALGIRVQSPSPVLALCRKLIDGGCDPRRPLEVYRGETLALRVRSIGQAAQLKVDVTRSGRPVFKREKTRVIAPPIGEVRN